MVRVYQKLLFQPSVCERLELLLFHSMLLTRLQLYGEALALLDVPLDMPMTRIEEERDFLREAGKHTKSLHGAEA